MAALCASLSFPYRLQQDDTIAVCGFGRLQSVEQLVKTAVALRQHSLSHLMNFFHDRIVFHPSSPSGDSNSSSGVTIMGVARCNPTFTSLSRRITSPLAKCAQFQVTR
jgi:hypothetical protein